MDMEKANGLDDPPFRTIHLVLPLQWGDGGGNGGGGWWLEIRGK